MSFSYSVFSRIIPHSLSVYNRLMKEIRYLDKLVDELAKGKAMEKIKRTNK